MHPLHAQPKHSLYRPLLQLREQVNGLGEQQNTIKQQVKMLLDDLQHAKLFSRNPKVNRQQYNCIVEGIGRTEQAWHMALPAETVDSAKQCCQTAQFIFLRAIVGLVVGAVVGAALGMAVGLVLGAPLGPGIVAGIFGGMVLFGVMGAKLGYDEASAAVPPAEKVITDFLAEARQEASAAYQPSDHRPRTRFNLGRG